MESAVLKKSLIALSLFSVVSSTPLLDATNHIVEAKSSFQKEAEEIQKRNQKIVAYHQLAFEVKQFFMDLDTLDKAGKLKRTSEAYTLLSFVRSHAHVTGKLANADKFEILNLASNHNIVRKKQLAGVEIMMEPAVKLVYEWKGKTPFAIIKNKVKQLGTFIWEANKVAKKGSNFTYNDIANLKL